ncbi:Uncharacterised protein [Mycobacteroides abscessus subsp. abscessus]|nr:Uncharacterised protein [Mycobacteroides abscessus subsp. abscessus]
MPVRPSASRKPTSGRAASAPVEAFQRGAANSRVRSSTCSITRSAAVSRSRASCRGSVANSARRRLVAAWS